jgi:aarF domain-containing kinase
MQWLSLPEEVEVFGSMMFQQLDLRHEAENLEVFERNFAGRSLPVTFPRPLKVWSTKDLMIEEYEVALPLETFMRNGGGPFDQQLATIGLDAFLVRDNSMCASFKNSSVSDFRICSCWITSSILTSILATSW